jgi:hypothetical protein
MSPWRQSAGRPEPFTISSSRLSRRLPRNLPRKRVPPRLAPKKLPRRKGRRTRLRKPPPTNSGSAAPACMCICDKTAGYPLLFISSRQIPGDKSYGSIPTNSRRGPSLQITMEVVTTTSEIEGAISGNGDVRNFDVSPTIHREERFLFGRPVERRDGSSAGEEGPPSAHPRGPFRTWHFCVRARPERSETADHDAISSPRTEQSAAENSAEAGQNGVRRAAH